MISEILILLTAIVFYFIGYFSGRTTELKELAQKTRKMFKKNKPGMVINYPTPDEVAYRGTEQERIDEAQAKLIKDSGLLERSGIGASLRNNV